MTQNTPFSELPPHVTAAELVAMTEEELTDFERRCEEWERRQETSDQKPREEAAE